MHVLRNFKLSRRRMLRGIVGGAAVAVGLPPLEAMLNTHGDALANGEPLPKRFISFMFGNGVVLPEFEPTTTGPNWELSQQLQPFAPVKDYVTVCTGMRNPTTAQPITHHEGMCVFSGYDYGPSNDGGFASNWGGPTIDQVIADIIYGQAQTTVRSMQVGVTKFDSPADNGTTAKVLSTRGTPGNLTALYPEKNPRQVWQNIFAEFTQPKDDRDLRLSVLDAVREDMAELENQLGVRDRQRLEAHLANVDELEQKIDALPPACELPQEPMHENVESNGSENLTLVNQLMSDLIAYAFVCDITRVASNLFCSVASESVFGDVPGSSTTHHNHSHSNDQGYRQNIIFIMQCLSTLMQTLRDTEDFEGTNLLDSTIVFASSEISSGWTHSWQRQPIIIGGHGRGWLEHPGIHYQAIARQSQNDDTTAAGSTTDILLTLARCFDPEHPSIGAGAPMSNTPLIAIMA
jgi:hypothetical protein